MVAFPDFKIELKAFFAAGNWVGSEWIMTGTRTGPSPNLPNAKKKFSIRGASIAELQNGMIIQNSNYWNMTSYLRQVGLMPNDWS
ncbi:MAG: ester cyclase [Desulfobacterales bacterium]|nr:MAG: ester cyclase [Desulfobacterales bacterium]